MVGGGKLCIVEESLSAARLVSATVGRHGISNQLLFAWHNLSAWRKAYRARPLGAAAGIVPAVVVAEPPARGHASGDCRIEIVSAKGRLSWPMATSRWALRAPLRMAGLKRCHDPGSDRGPGLATGRTMRKGAGRRRDRLSTYSLAYLTSGDQSRSVG
jgi:transposase-like protein